jgi:hypothetical protein
VSIARKPAARKPAARETAPAAAAKKPAARALKVVSRDPAAQLRAYCDELGALQAEAAEMRPKLQRIEVLKDLIRDRFEAEPAAKALEARGEHWGAALGPKAYRSQVDYVGLRKHMGVSAYAAIATPTLADLEKTLAPDVFAQFVKYDYTGARPVKTFAVAGAS